MKILTIGNAASPHILSRAKAFLESGCTNKILSEEKFEDANIAIVSPFKNLNLKNPWGKPYFFLVNLVRVARVIAREEYDILHIHYPSNYIAWFASIISKKPVVVILMGGDILFEQHQYIPWYHKALVKETLKIADLIIAKSPYIKERAIKVCGDLTKIIVCLFGVKEEFLNKEKSKKSLPLVFLSSRSVKPFYNLDKIIEVIWYLNKKQLDIAIEIVCFNPDYQYLDFLKNKVKELDLEAKVHFLPSVKSAEELLSLYQKSHFVIALPDSDGIPQSALEGMAQGCINILPRNENYNDIFTKDNSILVEGEAKAIAEQILEKIEGDSLENIAVESRKFIEEYGCLKKNIGYLKNCCEEIINNHQHKRKYFHKLKATFLLSVYFSDQYFFLGLRNKLKSK